MIRSSLIFVLAFLLIALSVTATIVGCTSGEDETFSYLVRVQDEVTSEHLVNARVTIEIVGKSPLDELTDSNGSARIVIDASRVGEPGRLIVQADGYFKHVQNIDLYRDILPDTIQLKAEPTLETSVVTASAVHTMVATSTSDQGQPIVVSSTTPSQSASTPTITSASPPLPTPPPTNNSVSTNMSLVNMLNNCPDIRQRLGREKAPIPVPDYDIAYQEYVGVNLNKGVVIYRTAQLIESVRFIAMLPDGTWAMYPDLWDEGMPSTATPLAPPDGLYRPIRGFEFVWLEVQNNTAVSQHLGWATTCEFAGDGIIWSFNEGWLFQISHFKGFSPTTQDCREEDITPLIGKTYTFFYTPGSSQDSGTWEDITYCQTP